MPFGVGAGCCESDGAVEDAFWAVVEGEGVGVDASGVSDGTAMGGRYECVTEGGMFWWKGCPVACVCACVCACGCVHELLDEQRLVTG